jgi:hypothetical protein
LVLEQKRKKLRSRLVSGMVWIWNDSRYFEVTVYTNLIKTQKIWKYDKIIHKNVYINSIISRKSEWVTAV